MQDNAGPLLDRVDLWGGIALGPLEIAGTRNGDPHVIADQLSRVANPADARLGAQAVARIQVLNVDPVLTAHVVFGRQARGEDDREVGPLPGGRVAVAGQMRACLKDGLRMHPEHAGQLLPVGIARKRTTTTTSVADRPFPGQGRVLTPRRPCPRIRVERPGQGYPTKVSPRLRGMRGRGTPVTGRRPSSPTGSSGCGGTRCCFPVSRRPRGWCPGSGTRPSTSCTRRWPACPAPTWRPAWRAWSWCRTGLGTPRWNCGGGAVEADRAEPGARADPGRRGQRRRDRAAGP